jgi:hypothetical protein
MKTNKASALLNFKIASDDKVKTLSQNVVLQMTKNANFPQPTVNIETFSITVKTYVDSMVPKSKSSSDTAAIKNQNKALVVADLVLLRNYVNAVSNGDRVMLMTSGFDITPENKLKPAPNTIPTNINVKSGNYSGTAQLSCDPQVAAVIYEARAKTGEENWTEPAASTKSKKVILKGLVAGKMYQFQMRTMGNVDYSEWSNSISMMVV